MKGSGGDSDNQPVARASVAEQHGGIFYNQNDTDHIPDLDEDEGARGTEPGAPRAPRPLTVSLNK